VTTLIVRSKLQEDFLVVPRKLAQNEELSFDARGLLLYLLSKPRDWRVQIADLRAAGQIGRDKAYGLLTELIQAGHVVRHEVRDAQGRAGGIEYYVYDFPLPVVVSEKIEPLPDFPDPAKPDPANTDAYKVENLTKKRTPRGTELPTDHPRERDLGFEIVARIMGAPDTKRMSGSLRGAINRHLKQWRADGADDQVFERLDELYRQSFEGQKGRAPSWPRIEQLISTAMASTAEATDCSYLVGAAR